MLWHRSDICCAVQSEVYNFPIIIFKLQVDFKPNHLLTCYLGRKRKGGTGNHDTHKLTDLLLLTDRFLHKIFCAEEVTRTCQVEATTSFFVDEVRGGRRFALGVWSIPWIPADGIRISGYSNSPCSLPEAIWVWDHRSRAACRIFEDLAFSELHSATYYYIPVPILKLISARLVGWEPSRLMDKSFVQIEVRTLLPC